LLKNWTLWQNWTSLGAALTNLEGDSPKLILPAHMMIWFVEIPPLFAE
jgi:hypothetical protein